MTSPKKLRRAIALLAIPVLAAPTFAAFLPTGPGTFEYTDPENWGSGTINNSLPQITGDQIITFATDYTTTGQLQINNSSVYTQTFAAASGTKTLTLGGSVSLFNTSSNTVIFDSSLKIALGNSARKLEPTSNRTLDIRGVVEGVGHGISKEGTGTLRLSNTANTFTGNVVFANTSSSPTSGPGIIEVTKLANGGQASSIGASDNAASRISFGGNTAGNAGTLRYVGTGDSTDRRFTIGAVGAKFDASGTGALNWTNTAAATYGNTGSARTVTFLGTSTHANTMAAGFGDSGAGATSIKKEGTGRWILSGANTYTGTTTIDAGTLELGSDTAGGDGSNMILNGGTFATGGFSESFGTLTVNADATIDFGAGLGNSAISFADSSAIAWGASVSLSIINFNEGDSIRFGINEEGLDALTQLGKIKINGHAVEIDELGYLSIASVPEPSSYAALAGAGALLLAFRRRGR